MRREANTPEKYLDIIRSIGVPDKTVTDNAKVLIGHRWTTTNQKLHPSSHQNKYQYLKSKSTQAKI